MKKTFLAASISLLFAIQGCGDKSSQQVANTTSPAEAVMAEAEKASISAKQSYLTMVENFFQEQLIFYST